MDWMSKVLSGTKDLLKCKDHVLVGIDGRCAAGKTTFAAGLQRKEGCSVISCTGLPWRRLRCGKGAAIRRYRSP